MLKANFENGFSFHPLECINHSNTMQVNLVSFHFSCLNRFFALPNWDLKQGPDIQCTSPVALYFALLE